MALLQLILILMVGALPGSSQAGAVPNQGNQQSPLIVATRLAEWQLAQLDEPVGVTRAMVETRDPRAWQQAAFWVGMMSLADATESPRLREAILAMGRRNQWQPAARPYHADDLAITAAYLWAAKNGGGDTATDPTRKAFEFVVTHPTRVSLAFYQPPQGAIECQTRWCWCDALFMAPPAMIELWRQTGDERFRDYALREFWATTEFLYDPAERLFYRDSRFFDRRDAQGRKLFWSRGNGWVFASLPRIIERLQPNSSDRRRMEGLFIEMASRLKDLQKADGYWAPSLLAPEGSPPETSGTAFYTYGLAWGIRAGLLDRASYEPAARKGWTALVRALQPDGRLGWVQQVSDRPDEVRASDTQYYGTGAFLLAATEMDRL